MRIPPCKWDCQVRARDTNGKEVVVYIEGVEAHTLAEAMTKAATNVTKLGLTVLNTAAEYSTKQGKAKPTSPVAVPALPAPPVVQQDLFASEYFTKYTDTTKFGKEEHNDSSAS